MQGQKKDDYCRVYNEIWRWGVSYNDNKYIDYVNHANFSFKEVSSVGKFIIGVASSAEVNCGFDPDDCAVYLGALHPSNPSLIMFNDVWKIELSGDELWQETRILVLGPLRKHFWQRRTRTIKVKHIRTSNGFTLEEALMLARKKAEGFQGITLDQETRIEKIIVEMKYRDQALKEIADI
jgi:hypothetical protein